MNDDPLTGYEPALPSDDQTTGHEPLLGGERSLVQALLASGGAEIAPSELLAAQLSKELPQLLAMLRRGDSRQRGIALRLIGMLAVNHPPSRPRTIPALIDILNDATRAYHYPKHRQVIEWLASTHDLQAARALVKQLVGNGRWEIRQMIMVMLPRLEEAAVQALTEAVTNSARHTVHTLATLFEALTYLRRTYPQSAPSLGAWITPLVLSGQIELTLYEVRVFIGEVYTQELVDGLMAIVSDQGHSLSFRLQALKGLGYISTPRVADFLFEVLTSGEKFLRLGAAGGLIRVRWRGDIPRLIALIHHDDPEVRRLALWIVHRRRLRSAVPDVIAAMADPDPRVRQEAVSTLAAYHDPSLVPVLLRALSDPRAEVRCKAITALARFNDPSLYSSLRAMTQDRAASVRRHAERTLRHLR